MADNTQIIIKHKSLNLSVDRSELVDVSETHDGIVFNFKGGVQLYYTNNSMPHSVKQIMSSTADNYPGRKLIFDLGDAKKPVLVDAT